MNGWYFYFYFCARLRDRVLVFLFMVTTLFDYLTHETCTLTLLVIATRTRAFNLV